MQERRFIFFVHLLLHRLGILHFAFDQLFTPLTDFDIRTIPGVPVKFGLRNTLFLAQPSTSQRDFVNFTEEERNHVSEKEVALLQKLTKEMTGSGVTGDESVADEFAAIKKKMSKMGQI